MLRKSISNSRNHLHFGDIQCIGLYVSLYTVGDGHLWIWIYPWISTENLWIWIWIWMNNFISTASLEGRQEGKFPQRRATRRVKHKIRQQFLANVTKIILTRCQI